MSKKTKAEKVKTRPVADNKKVGLRKKSRPKSCPASPLTHWPDSAYQSRRLPTLELEACPEAKLRPLKCAAWAISLNPDFGHLTVEPKPNTNATAQKWRECFGMLGHNYNCVAKLSKTLKVLMQRPVCTESSSKRMVFSFVIPPKPPAPIE